MSSSVNKGPVEMEWDRLVRDIEASQREATTRADAENARVVHEHELARALANRLAPITTILMPGGWRWVVECDMRNKFRAGYSTVAIRRQHRVFSMADPQVDAEWCIGVAVRATGEVSYLLDDDELTLETILNGVAALVRHYLPRPA